MKFSISPFIIDKSYASDLQNNYSASLAQNDLSIEILFKD